MQKLQEVCGDKVEVRFDENPLGMDAEKGRWIENFKFENMHWADIILVNNLSNYGAPYTARIVGKAKEFGKFVHYDTDDLLTELYEEHKLFEAYEKKGLSEAAKFIYSHADLVTVTQRKFAERIKPYCNNALAVVKNAIDYNLPGWNAPKIPSKKIRIGWAGGIHHRPDVKEFAQVPHLVNQAVGRENIQWDFYGKPPLKDGEKKDWQHEAWDEYRRVLTAGFKGQQNWNIHLALPPDSYGIMYSNMDIVIAPLQMNPFNDSKSDIKVAEAGRYGVPLVASNVGCYDETIKNWHNGVLIEPKASRRSWVKALTRIIKDHELRNQMGQNLKLVTDELFDINKVVGERLELYEECFKVLGNDPRK